MEKILSILIVMEMLAVNLFTVDICSHRKYSGIRTIATLSNFTILITAITSDWWEPLGFNQGNALFALIGIIYLLPLSCLYYDPPLRMSGILFSAWIYTLIIYCISVRVAYLMGEEDFIGHIALVQSVFYVVTIYPFIRWVKRGFLFVLHNIGRKNLYLLLAVSLCWFGTVMAINGLMIYPELIMLQIIVMIVILADAVLSYWLIVSMFKSYSEVKSLQNIVYVDPLTGICNREKFFVDVGTLMKKKKSFRLIFMDLNHFKSVNDQYGHQAGDRYLTAFALTTKALLQDGEELYRISGDEFIIISQASDCQNLIHKLRQYPGMIANMTFLGCSIGWADYPAEETKVDMLIALADQRMYRDKKSSSTVT